MSSDDEFDYRNRELIRSRRDETVCCPAGPVTDYRRIAEKDLLTLRDDIAEAEAQAARLTEWVAAKRLRLAELEYLTGKSDAIPGATPSTIIAGELTSSHLGMTVKSFTYRNARKSTPPSAGKSEYTIHSVQHRGDGSVLINKFGPFLRATSILAIVSLEGPPAA